MGKNEGNTEESFDEKFWAQLRALYNSNSSLKSDLDTNYNFKIGCPAGFEKIHISPYGDVTGCAMNPVSFGNIRNESLEKIIERMRRFRYFAKRYHNCLIAVDEDYIREYVDYSMNYPFTPYPVESNPHYSSDQGSRR